MKKEIFPPYDRKYIAELCDGYPPAVKRAFKRLCFAAYLEALNEYVLYYSPSKDFEQLHHVTGISADWKMPEGYSERKLEFECKERVYRSARLEIYLKKHPERAPEFGNLPEILRKEELQYHQSMYDEMKRLNPKLADIPVDTESFRQLNNLLLGCTSHFSAEDIRYYIHDISNLSETEREADFSWHISDNVRWRPSPETKERIVTALSQQPRPSPLLNELLQPHPLNPYNQTDQSP